MGDDALRVIVPFTHLSDGVFEALDASGYPIELHDVSGSDYDYYKLLARLWAGKDDVCVVEQDIVVEPDTLYGFDECPNPWCAAQYRYLGSESYTGLGCTRFRKELFGLYPSIMLDVGEMRDGQHEFRHWCVCDAFMQIRLREAGARVCIHPHVTHLSSGQPAHGCCGFENGEVVRPD